MKNCIGIFVSIILFTACNSVPEIEETRLSGQAQGSTFTIKYIGTSSLNIASGVDSIFKVIDYSLSTYNKNSLITAINSADFFPVKVDNLFQTVFNRSIEIANETNGAFDPTVGKLVELWGFGLSKRGKVDSLKVDSVMEFTGYTKTSLDYRQAFSMPFGFKIDFNAIAQGYTVDVLAEYLEMQGISDYFVEVGGETRAKGKNIKGVIWRIGIDKPEEDLDPNDRLEAIVALNNKSLATSGNYRKFWVDEKTGVKYAHTINPETGYPAKNKLLSASIIASTAMDADAYATVCMVLGVEKSKAFLKNKQGVEALLIYTNDSDEWEVFTTKGFPEWTKP